MYFQITSQFSGSKDGVALYFVANAHEYTKHYYIEGQRICSKLGGGFKNNLTDIDFQLTPIDYDYNHLKEDLFHLIQNNTECVRHNKDNITIIDKLNSLESLAEEDKEEGSLYFYHSDHLGSSSFITDATGISTQHLQYLPYGELFVEQRSTANYFTPYKFSAKEKDEETGYNYHGQRYYIPDYSFWPTVDQKADDYPHQSPFMYCSGNPTNRIDPDGMNDEEWELLIKKDGSIGVNKISDLGGKDLKIMKFAKEKENGDHIQIAKPIVMDTPKENLNSTPPNNTNSSAPWMDYALKEAETKVKEYDPGSNPRIETYLKSADLNKATDATAWCGAFVHWSLSQAGIKGAGASGNNYSNWGKHLDKPKYGAIAIFKTGQVGFYMDKNKDGTLKILHGNWSNRVKISSGVYDPIYEKKIKEYRWPK
jgi:uncharacterized protein (TIGR02594 family)